MKKSMSLAACLAALLAVAGCSAAKTEPAADPANASAAGGSRYLLAAEPAGAKDVISVRRDAADGDPVVIVGRIGGGENPWVDGRAAFSLVDASLESCLECGSGDCPKPWDFC